jgi:hypothetical protein
VPGLGEGDQISRVIRQPGGLAGPELYLDSRQLAAQLREHVVRRIDGYDCEPVRQQRGGELPGTRPDVDKRRLLRVSPPLARSPPDRDTPVATGHNAHH